MTHILTGTQIKSINLTRMTKTAIDEAKAQRLSPQ